MSLTYLHGIYTVFLSLLFSLFLTCADPDYPFIVNNMRIAAGVQNNSGEHGFTIGDSLTFTLPVEGIEFVDSILTLFSGDTAVWHSDSIIKNWYDTLQFGFRCSTIGNQVFSWHVRLDDQSTLQDSILIKISGIPAKITSVSHDTAVDERTTLAIAAGTTGTAPVNIRWITGDSVIPATTGNTLRFDSIHPDDAGIYRCIAENEWGTADTSDTITIVVNHVNRPPVLMYDTARIPIGEYGSASVVVIVNDPDGDSVNLTRSSLNRLDALHDTITCCRSGDSAVFTVMPGWRPGHADREMSFIAVFSDGQADDTAFMRFQVVDSNMTPRWTTNPISADATTGGGDAVSLSLSSFLSEPDNDPIDLMLLNGKPERDTINADGMTYSLRSIYAVPGEYQVHVVARDILGAADTLRINLSIGTLK